MVKYTEYQTCEWVADEITKSINADLIDNAIYKIIAGSVILLILLGFILVGAYIYIQNGDLMILKIGLGCGGVFIVFFAVFIAIYLPKRFKTAKIIDSNGITTRSGKTHQWQDLIFINYKHLRNSRRENVNYYELVFNSGKVVFPHLLVLDNGDDVGKFVRSIPAQIRINGVIRKRSYDIC